MSVREKISLPVGFEPDDDGGDEGLPSGFIPDDKKKVQSGNVSGITSSPSKSLSSKDQTDILNYIQSTKTPEQKAEKQRQIKDAVAKSHPVTTTPSTEHKLDQEQAEILSQRQQAEEQRYAKKQTIGNVLNNAVDLKSAIYELNGIKNPERLSEAKQGEILDQTITDPEFQEVINNNPKLAHEANMVKNGLADTNPTYVAKKIEQKVGEYIQEKGKNAMFDWAYTTRSQEEMDKIIDEMKDNGKISMSEWALYKKYPDVVRDWVKHEAPDVVHSLQRGVEQGAKGVESSLRDISNKATAGLFQRIGLIETNEDRTKRLQQEQDATPYVEPKSGSAKFIKGAGEFTGFAAPMIVGGVLTRGAGLSAEAAEIVPAALQFEGENADRARSLFPDDEKRQLAYTTLGTLIDVSLGKILPSTKAASKISALLRKDVQDAASKMTGDIATDEAIKKGLLQRFTSLVGNTAEHSANAANVVTGYDILHKGLEAAFGQRDFKAEEIGKEAIDTWGHAFVSSIPLSVGMVALPSPKLRGRITASIAENPERSIELINNEAAKNDEPIDVTEKKIMAVKDAAKAWGVIKDLPLSDAQKEKFLVKDLEQKELDKKAKETDVDVVKSDLQEKANEAYADKVKIYNGTDKAIEHENFEVPDAERKALIDEASKYKDEISTPLYRDIFKGNEEAILKEAAQQLNASPTEAETARKIFGDKLSDIALQLYPNEKVEVNLDINEPKTEENAIQEQSAGSVLQHPSGGAGESRSIGGRMEQSKQGEEITGTRPEEEKTGGEEEVTEEPNTVGISHESLNRIAEKLGLKKPERGTFLSPEEQMKRGRALLQGGVDPEKVASDFEKDGKASADEISVARAHFENLTREAQSALEKYGKNSEEFAKAKLTMERWQDDVLKPMGTSSGASFSALQGEADLDTGSFVSLSNYFKERTGKEPTPAQEKIIKELSDKVKGLSKDVEDLKAKLTEALDKAEKGEKGDSIKKRAKKAADTIRSLKASRPDTFSAATPASLVWDGAIEITAKTIETGGEIAQAIADGIAHIKESDWYKNLNQGNRNKAEKDFSEHIISAIKDKDTAQKLAEQFADKKDNKFTIDQAKDIWEYAKKNYLDVGADFDQMISGTSMDLGLNPEQIRDALTTPKGTKAITDAMYKKQNERNAAIQRAKDWASDAKTNPLVKFLRTIPRFFFAAKVFGHGTVGMVTHSGINIYDPVEWKRYWPTFFKQFAFAYGKQANYEKAMADLKNDPQFTFWKRNGLAIDPTERYDEYQFVTKVFEKMGKAGRVLTAGDRGFNALKVYRMQRAKALYNDLSNVEKSDPNTAKEIAKLVNHSTGTVGLKVSEVANTAFFAPKLELARWNKLIVDPAKAVKTFTEWGSATPAEKAAAKIVAKRAGRIMATYLGALAVNQGLLSLSGSNQKINVTNPMSSDWLKFKAGGRTIDLTGGMVSLLGFLARMGEAATHKSEQSKNKSRKDEIMSNVFDYTSGKLSPFAGTVKDLATHHDFQGNTLPFYDDKPMHSWNKKLTWKDYIANQQTPIPVAEFFKDLDKQMEDEGVKSPTRTNVIESILAAALVGGTGVHIGEEPTPKTTPFNDKDKQDPTFKYFLDKGMELPNTSLSSEKIKDKSTHTEKKISDYPKDIQEKYQETHKQMLKKELSDIIRKGYVYVNPYGDVATERNEEGKRKNLKDLTKEEMAKVLHIAQGVATTESKKKIFHLR